jgi:outer membrane scaffolding protein for murein synthesis (MipA/OmpV family)
MKMKSMSRISALVGWVLGGSLPIIPALAQDAAKDQPQPGSEAAATVWIVTLGAGTEYGPSYQGASDQSFSFVPDFDIRRLGEPADLSAPDDNLDYSLIDWRGLELGPVVGIRDDSRSTSDDSALAGLHDIDWSIDAGLFAEYWLVPNRFRLRVEGRQGVRSHDGFVADFYADFFQPVGSRVILSAGPRLSLANATYMRNNFSVTPLEAAANGSLPAFDAAGGLKSVGFVVSASYQFTDTMSVQVYDKFDRLVGDAADSPIVTEIGSANQNTVGIVLSRSFEISF